MIKVATFRYPLLATFLALLLCGPAIAADRAFSQKDWSPALLALKDAETSLLPNNWVPSLPDFPAYGSEEERNELAILTYLKNLRTEKTREVINAENLMKSAVDPFVAAHVFDPATKPATFALLDSVFKDSRIITMRAKYKFNRLRPSQVEPGLDIMFSYPPHASYPSGHATETMTLALLLADLDPEHKQQYMDVSTSCARNREIAGIHYPSDSNTGFILARQIVEEMKKSDKFKKLYGAAEQEYKG